MNIFTLSTDPVEAAQLMCDQHINKMILESAQLLSTTVHLRYGLQHSSPYCTSLYKRTHESHPCQFWLMESKANCDWLYEHLQALEVERQERWDRWETHQSRLIAAMAHNALALLPKNSVWAMSALTPPRCAMPLECQQFTIDEPNWPDAVSSYHVYYQVKKNSWEHDGKKMTWTNRPVPSFISNKEESPQL